MKLFIKLELAIFLSLDIKYFQAQDVFAEVHGVD
jgi:hypothetical protein